MIEIRWRYDPDADPVQRSPATAQEAQLLLHLGNRAFADLGREGASGEYVIPVSAEELGIGAEDGSDIPQTPMAVVLGCADARVPLELIFSQTANDLFVVRVAGNVLGGESVGSIDFALARISSVRLVSVVGHTGCGAVKAAVDAYLDPSSYLGLSANLPLRGIVDSLLAAVQAADNALRSQYGHERSTRPGYYEALRGCAVVLNAAVAGDAVQRMFSPYLSDQLAVTFGVYDLATRKVGLPGVDSWRAGLFAPPGPEAMGHFLADLVSSGYVRQLLDARG